VELTESYREVLPRSVRARYDFVETRNATRILEATNPEAFADLIAVLKEFHVDVALDISPAGGNESETAARLNHAFRDRGWQEGAYTVTIGSELVLRGPGSPVVKADEHATASYNIDNVKGRVALDVEWHAKDGNLDRDISAYRMLYDNGVIDCAAMVTMSRVPMREWVVELFPDSKKFATSTTTNVEKVTPRVQRGDGGGCPILIVGICRRTV